jgi:hypothetical protein
MGKMVSMSNSNLISGLVTSPEPIGRYRRKNESNKHIPTAANGYSGIGSVLLRTAKADHYNNGRYEKYF